MKALIRNGICRNCYKDLFDINLRNNEFKCDCYQSVCPICKENHHLVAWLKWNVRFKLLFKRSPNVKVEIKCDGYVIGQDEKQSSH